MVEPILSVRDLGVAFGSHQAVERVTFDIAAGETLALVGESGSGKSATALALMRLVEREGGRITGGTVYLGGKDPQELTALPEHAMRQLRGDRISMVFQEPMTSLNPVMTVGDQVMEAIVHHRAVRRREAMASAEAELDRVRIPEPARRMRQYPHELSGGLRQRVMIAMALACRPDVLIADEPTTALDVTTQAEILGLIRSLQAELGLGVLFITHDLGVVAQMAHRVVVLRHGAVVETASMEELFRSPRAKYSQELIAAAPRLGAGAPQPLETAAPVLVAEGISKGFHSGGGLFSPRRSVNVLNEVSLSICQAETVGLVGESGSGKSTFARAILRLVEPSAGRVMLAGVDLTALSPVALRSQRQGAQVVFQDPYASLNPRLSVKTLVTEPAALLHPMRAAERRALARDLLLRVGLSPDDAERYPHQFSGGQRQRICIARALSASPKLIVADEPVSALDVSIARRIITLLRQIQDRDGVAFLFISHDIAVVERVSHRVAVMYAGRIVEIGPTAQILNNPHHAYTQRLLAAVPSIAPGTHRTMPKSGVVGSRENDDRNGRLVEVGRGHFVRRAAA